MGFISFTADELQTARARSMVRGGSAAVVENIEHRCEETIAGLLCPWHQKSAKVVVDVEKSNRLEVEIVCCCDRFANRVRDALQETLHQS